MCGHWMSLCHTAGENGGRISSLMRLRVHWERAQFPPSLTGRISSVSFQCCTQGLLQLGSGIHRCFILSAIWDPYATFGFFFAQRGWLLCSPEPRLSRPSPSFPSFFNVYRAVISWFMEQMDNLRFTHLVEKAGSLLVIFIWYVGQGQVGMCWLKSRDDLVCGSIRGWPLLRSI